MASTSVTRPLYSARHDDIRQGHVNPTFVNYSDEMNTNLASALPSSQDTSPHNLATGDVIIEITSGSFNTNSSTFSEASLAASNLSAVNPSIGSGSSDGSSWGFGATLPGALRLGFPLTDSSQGRNHGSGATIADYLELIGFSPADTQRQSPNTSSDTCSSLTVSNVSSEGSSDGSSCRFGETLPNDPRPGSPATDSSQDRNHGSGATTADCSELNHISPADTQRQSPNTLSDTCSSLTVSNVSSEGSSDGSLCISGATIADYSELNDFSPGSSADSLYGPRTTTNDSRDPADVLAHRRPADQSLTGRNPATVPPRNPVFMGNNGHVPDGAGQNLDSVDSNGGHRYTEKKTFPTEEGETHPTDSYSNPSKTFLGADLKYSMMNKFFPVCIPVSIVFLICGGIALTVALLIVPSTTEHFVTKASVQVRVNDVFLPDMANTSSPTAVEYGRMFCYHMTDTVKKSTEVEEVDNCTVNNLSNGSIVVEFTLDVKTSHSLTEGDFMQLLRKSGKAEGLYRVFGAISMFNDNMTIFFVHTVQQEEETKYTRKVPAEFNCSSGVAHFKPLPYTYPAYCGHFQLCKNGQGTLFHCEAGLEFGYEADISLAPCRHKSNATYCGRKRSQDDALVTAVSTTTTTTTTTTEATTKSVTMLTTESFTSPTTTSTTCASIDPRILHNSTSLYTCSGTNAYTYRPRNDTYPDNCAHYLVCGEDGSVFPWECAPGTHFVLGATHVTSCYQEGDEATFCEQMRRAKTCPDFG